MITCSFCGHNETERLALIEGPDGLFICNECVELCTDVLNRSNLLSAKRSKAKNLKISDTVDFTPKDIVDKLNEYVIGQDKAKKILAVTIYNHYKKICLSAKNIHIQKSNLMLVGPTGTGKTYLLKQIAEQLSLPFITVDVSQLTPRGYKGASISDAWARLYNKCGCNEDTMKNAIVYFDEVDKMFSGNYSDSKEFYSMVQTELLKVLEDSELTFNIGSRMGGEQEITIDASNMLFVFGGAFSGIENIIQKRLGLSTKQSLGFGSSNNIISEDKKIELISKIQVEDLIEYGLMPEFVGRISNIVSLNPLSEEDLINIMTNTKDNVISQYKELFAFDGVTLDFEKDALSEIAKKAIERKTGARGLKSIIESSMLDLMYDLPSDHTIKDCKITKDFINGKKPAKFTKIRTKKPTIAKATIDNT